MIKMRDWEKTLLNERQQIIDAVRVIDQAGARISLIIDSERHLLGTITDYDVRQAILKGQNMTDLVVTIMNSSPKCVCGVESDLQIWQRMKKDNVRQMPLVDSNFKIIGMKLLSEFDKNFHKRTNPVLLMAGGLGTRLRPFTDSCPKPLLRVGSKPILEIILENFIEAGFSEFYFSVNYRADMIEDYFGDGSKFGVVIHYLHEKKRLGTAGALGLLPKTICEPILVMNGDILTKVDFHQLLDFHYSRHSTATMCVREYKYQVPYGVVQFENWEIQDLKEKPSYTEFVNAGIYVINPEVVQQIQGDDYLDMPDVFKENIARKNKTLIFPIREYWMDVGRMEDFEKAQEMFS